MAQPLMAEVIHMTDRTPSPQVEDGYTKIANELLEAIAKFGFSSRQYKVLFAVMRKTYGYNKKEDDISCSQIASICALGKSGVSATITQLVKMRVLNRRQGRFGHVLSIQKNYRLWIEIEGGDESKERTQRVIKGENHYTYIIEHLETKRFYIGVRSCMCHPNQDRYKGSGNWIATMNKSELVKSVVRVFGSRKEAELHEVALIRESYGNPLMQNVALYEARDPEVTDSDTPEVTDSDTPEVTDSDTPEVTDSDTPEVTDSDTTKENLPKENLPKEKNLLRNRDCASASFDAFWAIWPKKKDRKKALAAFAKINPDDALLQTILAAVAAQAATASWIDDGGEYIPLPTTWLNGARWEDEVKPVAGTFSADNQAFIDTFNANIGDKALPVGEWSQKIADLIAVALAGKWGMNLERWGAFWRFVRDDCQFKGSVSFEWLMNHDNIVRIVRGEFQ